LRPDTLRQFAPRARADLIEVLGTRGNEVLSRFGINATPLRFCHFMAQVAHECGGFTLTHESLKYRAERMVEVFGPGKHSANLTLREAKKLVGKEKEFAERVYGLGNPVKARDLGNTKPGDGYRYRGRGFLQITGRAAYRETGRKIGVDLEADPEKAAEPYHALLAAAAFWDSRNLNQVADRDDLEAVTRAINGGRNGLADRRKRLEQAKALWGGGLESAFGAATLERAKGRRDLALGSSGPDVALLKRRLTLAGYGEGVGEDDVFGRATHLAVVRFQLDGGLPADGLVEEVTWDRLEQQASGVAPGSGRKPDSRSRRGGAVVGWGLVVLLLALVFAAWALGWVPDAWRLRVAGAAAGVALVAGAALVGIGAGLNREARRRAEVPEDLPTRPEGPPDGEA
jgi:putative chitinase